MPSVVQAVAEHAARMVKEQALDALVLSGAVLAGYRAAVQPHVPVPVIDGIEAAAWQAVALGAQKPIAHRVGSYALARGRRMTGVDPQLAQRMR